MRATVLKQRRVLVRLAVALALVASGMALGVRPAHAAIINVPADHATISAAVAAASPTDTIVVAAGTYNEQVFIDKTLTLQGAKAGVDARTRATTGESIITHTHGPVQICANNVVIDGFTIEGANVDPFVDFTAFGAGIWTNPGYCVAPDGGYQILNNIIQDNIIVMYPNSTGVNPTTVQFNLFQNNNLSGPSGGSAIYSDLGFASALIDNNKFVNNPNAGILMAGTQSALTISNNDMGGNRIVLSNTTASSITGNAVMNSTGNGAIRFFGGVNGVSITGNALLNGVRGILISDLFPLFMLPANPNANITVHDNCIQGNSTAGLEVETGGYIGGTLDAENNWWGALNGLSGVAPGSGDAIVDPDTVVDFTPFLMLPSPQGCPKLALDHFACYGTHEKTKLPQPIFVNLADQFTTENNVKIRDARELCAPVSKNGEEISNPDSHLVCYYTDSKEKTKQRIKVVNQFGEQILKVSGKNTRLCVPSLKEVIHRVDDAN